MLPDSGENREFLFQLFSFMLKPARAGEILTSSEEQVIRNAIKTVVSGPPGAELGSFSSLLRGRIQAGEGDLTSRLESWIRPDQKGGCSTTPKIGSRFRIFSAST